MNKKKKMQNFFQHRFNADKKSDLGLGLWATEIPKEFKR
jgi:hypothetical protein